MQITKANTQGVEVLSVQGQLDGSTSPQLESELLTQVQAKAPAFIVDLGQVNLMSSAALRVLLSTAKRMKRQQGRILLCALSPEVKKVFEISDLTSLFEIFPGLPEALAAASAGAPAAPTPAAVLPPPVAARPPAPAPLPIAPAAPAPPLAPVSPPPAAVQAKPAPPAPAPAPPPVSSPPPANTEETSALPVSFPPLPRPEPPPTQTRPPATPAPPPPTPAPTVPAAPLPAPAAVPAAPSLRRPAATLASKPPDPPASSPPPAPAAPAPVPAPVPAASARPPAPPAAPPPPPIPPSTPPAPAVPVGPRKPSPVIRLSALALLGLLAGGGFLAYKALRPTPAARLSEPPVASPSPTAPPARPTPTPASSVSAPPTTPAPTSRIVAPTPAPTATPLPAVTPAPTVAASTSPAASTDATAVKPPAAVNLDARNSENQQVRQAVLQRIDAMTVPQKTKDQLYAAVDRARGMGKIMTITFASGRTDLTPTDIENLRRALQRPDIQKLTDDPTMVIVALGFADSRGNEQKNKEVSERRAQKTVDALRGPIGLLNTMHAMGMGGSDLFGKGDLERNRIVEVWAVLP